MANNLFLPFFSLFIIYFLLTLSWLLMPQQRSEKKKKQYLTLTDVLCCTVHTAHPRDWHWFRLINLKCSRKMLLSGRTNYRMNESLEKEVLKAYMKREKKGGSLIKCYLELVVGSFCSDDRKRHKTLAAEWYPNIPASSNRPTNRPTDRTTSIITCTMNFRPITSLCICCLGKKNDFVSYFLYQYFMHGSS